MVWPVGGAPLGANAIARTTCDWSMMSCRKVSRVRKKFALTRKLEETTGIPWVPVQPHAAGLALQAGLTAWYVKPVLQVPGGLASPCPAVPGMALQVAPAPKHCGIEVPATFVWPLMQKERSPCLAASTATTVKPLPASVSATVRMSARPRPRPWRKTTRGEHFFPNGARFAGQAGKVTVAAFG